MMQLDGCLTGPWPCPALPCHAMPCHSPIASFLPSFTLTATVLPYLLCLAPRILGPRPAQPAFPNHSSVPVWVWGRWSRDVGYGI